MRTFIPVAVARAGVAALAIAAPVGLQPAAASDHQDTLRLVSRPGADITDLYVFPAKNPDDVAFALDVHPLVPRGMADTVAFDPGVLYQIKIDTVGDRHAHMVLQFKAEGTGASQRVTFYGPGVARTPVAMAPQAGTTTLGQASQFAGGVSFFAGARQDPFYFDLTQFFKINPDRNYKNHPDVPAPSATCFNPVDQADNFLKDFNVLSLVVEMPRKVLTTKRNHGRINVWATTSVADSGTGAYVQIERWGRPGVKEALEPFNQHDASNRSEPYADPTLSAAIYRTMTAPKPAGAGRSPAIASALQHVLVPDELEVDLSAKGPATYLAIESKGKSGLPVGIVRVVPNAGLKGLKKSLRNGARLFGGRDLNSPVIDLSLGAIYGSILPKIGLAADDQRETACLTSDNVKPSVKTLDGFPYLPAPV